MSAAAAWLILILGITAYVAGYDLWAVLIGHSPTMTGQFRAWLFDPVTGPFIVAFWVGAWAGLTAHWFLRRHG